LEIAWILLTMIDWIHSVCWDWRFLPQAAGFFVRVLKVAVDVMPGMAEQLPGVILAVLTICLFRRFRRASTAA
jgi:hypothetical protein